MKNCDIQMEMIRDIQMEMIRDIQMKMIRDRDKSRLVRTNDSMDI